MERNGDPARQIIDVARTHNADLIVMATHERWRMGIGWSGERRFFRFLMKSVAAQVMDGAPCPVWTGRWLAEKQEPEFAAHKVLCFLDLGHRSRGTLASAAQFASVAGAKLMLVHAIPSAEIWVPGGSRFAHMWKGSFEESAARKITILQREVGTNAAVVIDTGTPRQVLARAAAETGADAVVTGHWQQRNHWENPSDAIEIIRNSDIPVLISNDPAN